ncbi:MAG: succinylglutamate desuccinylase/aspartoacylase family protein [Candidatus Moranbacteria bacterium]|nr:succinylglutamate desuccinylase/aspartoacylase family protein [Candidatus Moranbacteria bacterium]
MKNNKKILLVTAVHGDESIGVEVIREINKTKLCGKFASIIANPRALKKKVRFIESDLNRVFPGDVMGNYEERRAEMLFKKIQKYDCVIDLHGSVSKTGIFIIMTKLNLENLGLALLFNIKRILIWPSSSATKGSLVTFAKNGVGIEIESGEKSDNGIKRELKKILLDFLKNSDRNVDIEKEMKNREFFSVIGQIKRKNKKTLKLEDWKKMKNFYPLFVGQYPDLVCYKLKKIKNSNVLYEINKQKM